MYEGNGTAASLRLSNELLELATADLYRNNLFRVLAIPIDSSPADVRRQQKRIEMQAKLGMSAASGAGGILPLAPPPTPEAASLAIERLNDPVSRCLDELFWFSAPPSDAGLAALERGDVSEARKLWKRSSGDPGSAVYSQHNLAVMEHLLALEDSKPEQHAQIALTAWKTALDNEAFWEHIRARVASMNEARLTSGFIRRLRDTMPRMLLLIVARQSVDAFQKGETATSASMLDIMRKSPYGTEMAEEAVREALKPLRARITAAIAAAKGRWTKDPQHGDRIARDLYTTLKPLLAAHDRMADNDMARQSVHDEVADAIVIAEVAFCKATNDWLAGAKLLELAREVAIGEQLLLQISENTRIDKANAEYGNDWCAPGYWDLAPEIVAELERARGEVAKGNFDAALEILLVMDKEIGFPLKRAVAHCLSVKAIRSYNAALGEYQSIRPMVKKILDSLPSSWSKPNPHLPSYMMPPCLACGSTYYSSWVNFSFEGQGGLFMCTSCSATDDVFLAKRKKVMCEALPDILDHLALAGSLDPKDPGIAKNRDGIKKDAVDFGHTRNGDANNLAKKLKKERVRRTQIAACGNATDTCFFCSQRPGDQAAAILVPMQGPEIRTTFLYGNGVSCESGDVIVPRCSECRRHHAELPERIEAWHEETLLAADRSHFAEASAAEAQAAKSARSLEAADAQADKSVERARAELEQAVANQNFLFRLLGRPNPARDAARVALEAAQQRKATVATQSQEATARHESSRASLRELRDRAMAAYKAAVPAPQLPADVRPESDLMDAPTIGERRHIAWIVADQPTPDSPGAGAVKGTVSRLPVLRALDQAEDGTKQRKGKG
jgi:hypothetical protein